MIPLKLRVNQSGQAEFVTCLQDREDPQLGNVLYLQGVPTTDPHCPIALDINTVVNAIEASSAFPLAFGRKDLKYCEDIYEGDSYPDAQNSSCPDGFRPAEADCLTIFLWVPPRDWRNPGKMISGPGRSGRRRGDGSTIYILIR